MKRFAKTLAIIVGLLVIAFLLLRVPDTDPTEMRVKYGGEPSQFVTLANGQEVHLRDEGPRDAPAIVLLHGSNADLHTWQPWVDTLRDRYRVIRFDQIGHGLTGAAIDQDYANDRYVEAIDLVADKLDVDRFVLAGNSMGGGIAMRYALARSERLNGLVLIDASGADIPREGSGNLAFKIARLRGVGSAMSQLLPRSLVERSLSQSVTNQNIVTDAAVDRYWEMARYPGNRVATRARFSRNYEPFAAERVAMVSVPVLVMWGEKDALIPFAAAGWYMDHLPNAELASYPDIGHLPMEETPVRSLRDLQNWLVKILPNAASDANAG
ncbi:alpha/beta fold hydrolase [Qipengyuania sp. CAU 1752]